MTSPSQITVPTDTPDGTVWYFINTRGGKCEEGIKIAVTVTGGEGGTSGQCVAIACRSSNNGANPAKDYECCSIADSYGYKASCAVGFTYYQWDRQSDSVGGWQDESVTCRTDGASSPDGSCEERRDANDVVEHPGFPAPRDILPGARSYNGPRSRTPRQCRCRCCCRS